MFSLELSGDSRRYDGARRETEDYIPEAFEKIEKFLFGIFPDQIPQHIQQRLDYLKTSGNIIVSDEALRAKQIEHGEDPELLEFTVGMHDIETDILLFPKHAKLGTVIHEMLHFVSFSPGQDDQGRICRSGFRYVDSAGNLHNKLYNEVMTVILSKMVIDGINISQMIHWEHKNRIDYFFYNFMISNNTSYGEEDGLDSLGQSYKEALFRFTLESGIQDLIYPLSKSYFMTQAEIGENLVHNNYRPVDLIEKLENLEPRNELGYYNYFFGKPSRQLMNPFRYPKEYQKRSKKFKTTLDSANVDWNHSNPHPVYLQFPEYQSELVSFRMKEGKVTVWLLGDNEFEARLIKLIGCEEAIKPLILWEGYRILQAIEAQKDIDERQIFSDPVVVDYLQRFVKTAKLFQVIRHLSYILNIHLKPEDIGGLTMELGGEKAWEAYYKWTTSFHFNDFEL